VASSSRSRLIGVAAIALPLAGFALVAASDLLNLTAPAAARGNDVNLSLGRALVPNLPMLALVVVALLLSRRRPDNPVGWLVVTSLIAFGVLLLGSVYGSRYSAAHDVPFWPMYPMLVLSTLGWSTSWPALLILLPLVFPDGHLVSRRWRIAVWLTVATIVFTFVTSMLAAIPEGPNQGPVSPQLSTYEFVMGALDGPVSGLFMFALIVSAVVSLVIRYRRAGADLRHQLKWFVAAIAVAGLSAAPQFVGIDDFVSGLLLGVGLTAVPASIAVAVFRYRLYDIDVIINRALVYGALAAFITAIYVGIVVGIGSLIGSGGKPNLALSIVATALVAVGFQPARERLQRVANRLVYGKRATPYEVLSEFSGRVAETFAADEVLPRMARVLRDGTGADHATVWLRSGAELRPAATAPESVVGYEPMPMHDGTLPVFPDGAAAVPVQHQGHLLGALSVNKRHGESLTPIEQKLLDDLAHQAGLVLKNVGLTDDLQARLDDLRESRKRLVAAQDQERRRLERNLHDGAQQYLVAIKVKLGLAETLAGKDPERARATLAEIKGDADEALETLRDLARGIYPPLLAEKGLVAALEAQARKATLPVTVEADGVGRYPQEVEAAVYFCVLEALQNVQKYAGATRATVRLDEGPPPNPPPASGGRSPILTFVVEDDGGGFDPDTAPRGSGLTNMADRVEALGGTLTINAKPAHGTTLVMTIPIAAAVTA